MIRVPQHTEAGPLNDLPRFIEDLESFQRMVDYWLIEIDECTGKGSIAFEELSKGGAKLSYLGFASFCNCITQTIDGIFTGFIADRAIIKLEAVDSTYWEITGPKEFEEAMLNKYGEHGS